MESITSPPTTEEIQSTPGTVSGFQSLSIEELQQKLEKALAEEAYEKAARIRDEINRRNAS
ncbi:UvrB/uvrC motif protein [compost metagenome]